MIDRLQSQSWMLFVLPGAVSLFVAGFISDFPQIRDVLIPFVYVALTALSVVLPLLIAHAFGRLTGRSISTGALALNGWFVASVFGVAIALGFLFGVAHSTDHVSSWLRATFGKSTILISSHTEPLRLLFREAYQDDDFIAEFDGIPSSYIPMKEKNMYAILTYGERGDVSTAHGVVHSYNSGTERPQAYLTPACTEEDGVVTPVTGPGMWVNLDQVRDVKFVYQSCSACAAVIKATTGNGPMSKACPFVVP